MLNDDFFIGFEPRLPARHRRAVRLFLIAAGVFLAGAAFVLVSGQRQFANSAFELGTLTTLEGTLQMEPVPMLLLNGGAGPEGQPLLQSVILIGFGKHGAEAALAKAAEQRGVKLNNQRVKLEGTLIYSDGKTLLELTRQEAAVLDVREAAPPKRDIQEYGTLTLLGEIADPKCFFGVMKPGEGKVHRSCAARCIAGGIPPVLKAAGKDGIARYFLLEGQDGKPVNKDILPLVGQAVQLKGLAIRYDDWMVLRIAGVEAIEPLSSRLLLEAPMCRQLSILE